MNNSFYSTLRLVGVGLIFLSLGWAAAEKHFASGNYEAALTGYEEVLQQAPDFVAATHAHGRTLMILGRFEEALADFNRAIERKPDFAVSLANRAILKDRLSLYGEALRDYEQAFKLEPELAKVPSGVERLLNRPTDNTRTMEDRAAYLRQQLALPQNQRKLPFSDSVGKPAS
jgi:tetratricopeptide (TPR) repeat protein